MENQGISLARDCPQKIQSQATRHHQRFAVGQNQVENDGSTASGSDPENPPAARRGPVQTFRPHLRIGHRLLGNVFAEEDEH